MLTDCKVLEHWGKGAINTLFTTTRKLGPLGVRQHRPVNSRRLQVVSGLHDQATGAHRPGGAHNTTLLDGPLALCPGKGTGRTTNRTGLTKPACQTQVRGAAAHRGHTNTHKSAGMGLQSRRERAAHELQACTARCLLDLSAGYQKDDLNDGAHSARPPLQQRTDQTQTRPCRRARPSPSRVDVPGRLPTLAL